MQTLDGPLWNFGSRQGWRRKRVRISLAACLPRLVSSVVNALMERQASLSQYDAFDAHLLASNAHGTDVARLRDKLITPPCPLALT